VHRSEIFPLMSVQGHIQTASFVFACLLPLDADMREDKTWGATKLRNISA
jgi:hypothetical protein